jgi:hypothetical protein
MGVNGRTTRRLTLRAQEPTRPRGVKFPMAAGRFWYPSVGAGVTLSSVTCVRWSPQSSNHSPNINFCGGFGQFWYLLFGGGDSWFDPTLVSSCKPAAPHLPTEHEIAWRLQSKVDTVHCNPVFFIPTLSYRVRDACQRSLLETYLPIESKRDKQENAPSTVHGRRDVSD